MFPRRCRFDNACARWPECGERHLVWRWRNAWTDLERAHWRVMNAVQRFWSRTQEWMDARLADILYKTEARWVNVYHVEQRFGGPEEGGWWYDEGIPLKAFGFWILKDEVRQAEARALAWAAEYNHGRPPLSSVTSTGRALVHVETHPPRPYPERRPHYE